MREGDMSKRSGRRERAQGRRGEIVEREAR